MYKNVLKSMLVLLAAGLVSAPHVSAQRGGRGGGFSLAPLVIQTNAFADGAVVPVRYSQAGDNVQPAFTFSGAPDNTVAYALIMTDLDVAFQGPQAFMHWAVWNIPAAAGGLPEGGIPDGATQTGRGYRGPGAPAGPYHHYVWELYALSAPLEGLEASSTREDILAAMEGKVVAKAAYVGRYRREG